MQFDGVFSSDGSGVGIVLTSPTGDKLYYAIQLCFGKHDKVSNNIAKYEGLIGGIRATIGLGIKRLIIKGNSQLLFNFSNKVYQAKDAHMALYLEEVHKLEKRFLGLEL